MAEAQQALRGAETSAEIETWLTAPWDKAKALQRPLPHHLLTVVTKPEAIAA
jgi:putative SOS response-associated peptidase YedK